MLQGCTAMTHASDSREQRDAEPLILAGVAARLGVKLRPCSLRLPNGARIDVDGAAEDESVFCEVYARQGRLRGAQPKKVASDALKLITLARNHPDARLVLAFSDEAAAACVTGKSWLAETIRVWEIEVVVISLDPTVREGLRDAQARQVMENPVVDARPSR
jgi:hypothetical protein